MKHIGILIEMENGAAKESNFGMITLANRGTAALTALVLNDSDNGDSDKGGANDALKDVLAAYGVSRVVVLSLPADDPERFNPALRANVVARAVKDLNMDALLGLSSADGKDIIPRVAALLDAPLVMDCTDVDLEQKTAKTSQYSGKVMADIRLTGDVVLFGIRPNAVKPVEAPVAATLETLDTAAESPRGLKLVSWSDGTGGDGPSLAEADIIISGGRGMKNGENFSLLFDCAKKMKAAVGASRVAVDEGWISYAHQVGQTGEKVSPSVYIACGISGSIQHFAGMKTAKMIIAVNTDENAAMVANSDYYVLGDLFDILPELGRQL